MITKKISDYVLDLKQRLGKGAYGEVYLGQDQKTGRIVAVKQIPLQHKSHHDLEKVQRVAQNEIGIMQKINDQNIVQFFDVHRTPNNLYVFMEYCNSGTLDHYIQNKCPSQPYQLSETEAIYIIKQVVRGFKVLYDKRIVHRDLKPQNLLIHDGVVKIADFGFSKVIEFNMEEPLLRTYAGSPLYMAPQILRETQYSSKADVWSLGIIFYEILYGQTPWIAYSIQDLIQKIEHQPLKFPPRPIVSQETQQIIMKMLEKDEYKRIGWDQLFKHYSEQMEVEKLKNSLLEIKKEPDNLRRSNAKKNIYFGEQQVVQNIQHAEQLQERYQAIIKIEEEDLQSNSSQTTNNSKSPKQSKSKERIFSERKRSRSPKQMDLYYQQQQQDISNKKIISQIADWIVHRKNKSVFLNIVSQQWFDFYEQYFKTTLEQEYYYTLLFLLTKYQTSILYKMYCRLNLKRLQKSNKFTEEQWQLFCKSLEYQTSVKTIKNDYTVIKQFLKDVVPRTKVLIQNTSDPLLKKINQICDLDMTVKKVYDDIFKEFIRIILNVARQYISQQGNQVNRNIVIFATHLMNCLRMNEVFKYKGQFQIDYFKYYENIENEPLNQLLTNLQI